MLQVFPVELIFAGVRVSIKHLCRVLQFLFYLHHVEFLILIELALLLSGGILVLLVLRDEIVHVGLSLSELHLVHALTGVPMKESLSSEHLGELLSDSLEHLLDSGGVTKEGNCHLEALWWDVTDSGLNVVWDPFNEVR